METDLVFSDIDYSPLEPQVAGELKDRGTAVRTLLTTIARSSVEVGMHILAVKENKSVPPRMFQQWVVIECGLTNPTARRRTRIARFVRDIVSERLRADVLKMSDRALDHMSRKGICPLIRSTIFEQVQNGYVPTEAEIVAMVSDHKRREIKERPAKKVKTGDASEEAAGPDLYDAWRQSENGIRAMFVHDHFKAISKLAPMAAVEKARKLERDKFRGDVFKSHLDGDQTSAAKHLVRLLDYVTGELLSRAKTLQEVASDIAEPERSNLGVALQQLATAVNALVPRVNVMTKDGELKIVVNNKPQTAEPDPAANGESYFIQYQHLFEHGTCHLLPKNDDYESPEWKQWRANNPYQWYWRRRELDANGDLVRDAKGKPLRPGPWLKPDGSKRRVIDGASPEGQKIMAEWEEARRGS